MPLMNHLPLNVTNSKGTLHCLSAKRSRPVVSACSSAMVRKGLPPRGFGLDPAREGGSALLPQHQHAAVKGFGSA
jgi:hypothetical protein